MDPLTSETCLDDRRQIQAVVIEEELIHDVLTIGPDCMRHDHVSVTVFEDSAHGAAAAATGETATRRWAPAAVRSRPGSAAELDHDWGVRFDVGACVAGAGVRGKPQLGSDEKTKSVFCTRGKGKHRLKTYHRRSPEYG
jgi:hypothetical protein